MDWSDLTPGTVLWNYEIDCFIWVVDKTWNINILKNPHMYELEEISFRERLNSGEWDDYFAGWPDDETFKLGQVYHDMIRVAFGEDFK